MKKVELSETYIEDVLEQKLTPRTDHFVIENGIMIPWDIAMDPKQKLEYVESELKKETVKVKALEAQLRVKQYEELEKLKPNISDILWVAGIAMAIALIFIL